MATLVCVILVSNQLKIGSYITSYAYVATPQLQGGKVEHATARSASGT